MKSETAEHVIAASVFLCFVVYVLIAYFLLLAFAELAMWRECDNRRPYLHNLICNSSIPAPEGKI